MSISTNTNNAKVNLYKASAGAGKTYRLTLEVIKLLVEDPTNYKKILAVTFTNKATEEMQTRIVTELFDIAKRPSKSELIDNLQKETGKSRETIIQNCGKALSNILHDYNHFQISTIDSFFQTILRNLAKELGLGAYLNIIIDESEVLDDALKLLINDIKDNDNISHWINNYAEEKSDSGKSWRVDDDLRKFGEILFKESFMIHKDKLANILKDHNAIKNYKAKLEQKAKDSEQEILTIVDKIDKVLANNSINPNEDLTRGSYTFANQFKVKKWSEWETLDTKSTWIKVTNDSTKWPTSKTSQKAIINSIGAQLSSLYLDLEEARQRVYPDIALCHLILNEIHKLGIIHELNDRVRKINEQRNQFMLCDTPTLLHSMINDSDTPFIYDKIGTRLEDIMIDEFQDTSTTQWHNFKPLVEECIAQGKMSLVVGDAKQSIYRFRNGDWEIIESLSKEFSKGYVQETNLQQNWRSQQVVVDFNNQLFSPKCNNNGEIIDMNELPPILQPFQSEYAGEELFDKLCNVYRTSFQQCQKKVKRGYVQATFLPIKEGRSQHHADEELVLEKIREMVEMLQDKGIAAKDITILTRKGRHIELIAEYFSQYKEEHPDSKYTYNVISNEAFKLESSKAISMIINAMKVILNPSDQIAMIELYFNYMQECSEQSMNSILSDTDYTEREDFKSLKESILQLSNLPIYEMAELLVQKLSIDKIANQESYLCTFFDGLNEFITRKSPDVGRFIDFWENSLHKKAIPFSNDMNGMQILTIHKSKGLEFHSVILPFAFWDLYDAGSFNSKNILWCETDKLDPMYQDFPVLPVNYESAMMHTELKDYYQRERIQLLVDSLNILYVALTRAKCNLLIIGDNPTKANGYSIKNISQLLFKLLGENEEVKYGNITVYEEEEEKKKKKEQEKKDEEQAEKIINNPFKQKVEPLSLSYTSEKQKAKFKSSQKANELLEQLTENESPRNKAIQKGVLLHYLFSIIATEEDIPNAANQLLFEGFIKTESEKEELISYAKEKIIKHREWFRPGLKLYNECSILFKDKEGKLKSKRPDRVIQEGNKMTIIDFKTGKYHSKAHEDQINGYATLLKEMGYTVETHLWYLEED